MSQRSPEPLEGERRERLDRARVVAQIALLVLSGSVIAAVARDPSDALTSVQAGALIVFAAALCYQLLAGARLNERQQAGEVSFTRLLQGFSRSASSEAIVQAAIDELRRTADAHHVVVARVRLADRVVETTLVSTSAQIPASRTTLPLSVLERPSDEGDGRTRDDLLPQGGSQLVADDLARLLGDLYGLPRTLAEPLVANGRVIGALMLSRRQPRPWTAADRRLLARSAHELSAALARAYAFEEAESQANLDPLTGLPNRRYLEELMSVVGPGRRADESVGALMVDIDHFKRLNDRYGHATGDRVLQAVGERIHGAVRAEDTPARYGGEEFAVLLRRANAEQAIEVAERVRQAIAAIPVAELGAQDGITVSVGVAVTGSEDVDVTTLLRQADAALYRAKRSGRDRVVLAA